MKKRIHPTATLLCTALTSLLFVGASSALAVPPEDPVVVALMATGDSGVDTPALQAAVNALPPGGILHLSGHFKVHHEILADSFDGTIEGDGIGLTVVEAIRGPTGYFEPAFFLPNGQPRTSIFAFIRTAGSQLVVRNLTLTCNDPAPCAPTMMWGWPDPFTVMAAFVVDLFGENKHSTIENVEFHGAIAAAPHAEGVHNCIIGVLSNSSSGSVALTIRECEAEQVDIAVLAAGHGPGSADLPSTIAIDRVTGDDVGMLVYLAEVHCETTIVQNCQVTGTGGLFPMVHVGWSENVEIAHCTLVDVQSPAVIELTNADSCLVRSNLIFVDDATIPGIRLRTVDNTLVKANTLQGKMLYPLSVEGNSTGNLFLGNNLRHAESAAKIYLGPEAASNTLRGYSGGEVIDDVGDYTIWQNGTIVTQARVHEEDDGWPSRIIDLCAAGPAYMPDGTPGHYASGVDIVFLWDVDWSWSGWYTIPGHYVEVPAGTGDYVGVPWGDIHYAPAAWVGLPGTHDFVQDCTIVPKVNHVTGNGPMQAAP